MKEEKKKPEDIEKYEYFLVYSIMVEGSPKPAWMEAQFHSSSYQSVISQIKNKNDKIVYKSPDKIHEDLGRAEVCMNVSHPVLWYTTEKRQKISDSGLILTKNNIATVDHMDKSIKKNVKLN